MLPLQLKQAQQAFNHKSQHHEATLSTDGHTAMQSMSKAQQSSTVHTYSDGSKCLTSLTIATTKLSPKEKALRLQHNVAKKYTGECQLEIIENTAKLSDNEKKLRMMPKEGQPDSNATEVAEESNEAQLSVREKRQGVRLPKINTNVDENADIPERTYRQGIRLPKLNSDNIEDLF